MNSIPSGSSNDWSKYWHFDKLRKKFFYIFFFFHFFVRMRHTRIYRQLLHLLHPLWFPGSNSPIGNDPSSHISIWAHGETRPWPYLLRSSARWKSTVASVSTARTPPWKIISWHQLRVVQVKAFCIVVTTLNNLAVLIWLNYLLLYCCLFYVIFIYAQNFASHEHTLSFFGYFLHIFTF